LNGRCPAGLDHIPVYACCACESEVLHGDARCFSLKAMAAADLAVIIGTLLGQFGFA
jgi:hypothetical protein